MFFVASTQLSSQPRADARFVFHSVPSFQGIQRAAAHVTRCPGTIKEAEEAGGEASNKHMLWWKDSQGSRGRSFKPPNTRVQSAFRRTTSCSRIFSSSRFRTSSFKITVLVFQYLPTTENKGLHAANESITNMRVMQKSGP